MLVLWIPMVNGDHNNYGVSNFQTTILGTVEYESGASYHIGESARIGSGSQVPNGISINSNLVEELGDEYSCAVWIRPTGNHVHAEGAIISSGNWNSQRWAFGVKQDNSGVDMMGPGHQRYLSCDLPVGTWTHLVSTFKNNVGTLYKNGVLIGTYTFNNQSIDANGLQSDATNTTIGRETYANGYFSFNGCIQDLRMYNHCLSAKEAKELSKGLVRHYPLSRLSTNFVDTTKSFPVSSGKVIAIKDGVRTLGVDADTFFNIPLNQTLIANTTYTLSFYASEVKEGATLRFGLGAQSNTNENHCGIVDVKTGYNTHTFTPSVNISNQIIMDDTQRLGLPIVEMTHFKIEEGSIATPWIPSPADLRFTKIYGLTSEKIYDTSGFGNTATINGHPTSYSWSARYSGSIGNFTNSKYITAPSLPSSTKTISFWVKSGTISGSQVVFADYGSKIAFGFNGNNTTYIVCDLPSGSGYSTGSRCVAGDHWKSDDWNHFVIIKLTDSPYTFKTYLNGNLLSASSTNYWTHTTDDLMIGRRSSGSPFGGQISDFRAYATELSEDDILELYHTPISLTKQGTLITQGEYVEVM